MIVACVVPLVLVAVQRAAAFGNLWKVSFGGALHLAVDNGVIAGPGDSRAYVQATGKDHPGIYDEGVGVYRQVEALAATKVQ